MSGFYDDNSCLILWRLLMRRFMTVPDDILWWHMTSYFMKMCDGALYGVKGPVDLIRYVMSGFYSVKNWLYLWRKNLVGLMTLNDGAFHNWWVVLRPELMGCFMPITDDNVLCG